MMEVIKAKKAEVREALNASFPNYRGRKFNVVPTSKVIFHDTNWGGGSRNSYCMLSRDGRSGRFTAPAPWDNPLEGKMVELTPEFIVVEHSIFCGEDLGIRFYVHPDSLPRLLTAG